MAPSQNYEVRDVPYYARPSADASLRQRVLVLPFIDEKTTRSEIVSKTARATVVKNLLRTGRFVVVNNNDYPSDLKKHITGEREYDLSEVSKVAASLGIAAVVEGKILEVKAKRNW